MSWAACGEHLVTGKNGVTDSALAASTKRNAYLTPEKGRLDSVKGTKNYGAWEPSTAKNQWIQVSAV